MNRYPRRPMTLLAAALATLCCSMSAHAASASDDAAHVPDPFAVAQATATAPDPFAATQAAASAAWSGAPQVPLPTATTAAKSPTVVAQAAPAPPAPAPVEEEDQSAQIAEDSAQNSREQGQSPMDESFAPRSRRDWIREQRRQAWKDTKWDIQVRSYYLGREKFDDTKSEAWALGGSVGFKTGYFRDRFALGMTGYTSQKLIGDEDEDGTTLLAPGQEGYTVLGEIYGEFIVNDDIRINLGRKGIDTPYINRNDSRMTPNTFESVTINGLHGGEDRPEWRWGFGYFDEIKERTSEEFVSMAEDAGAPDGVERGVYALGANYKFGDFSIGAIDYHSIDIINIFYTEAKYSTKLSEDSKLSFGAQYSYETSTGDLRLRGEEFDSDQWGVKGEWGYKGALFTVAYTSAGGDSNMQNPWSGYPGYTSVQVEDFNRAGEDAWMLRAGYTFQGVKGLSLYGLYVDGSDPDSLTDFAKEEYDFNLQWSPPEGVLKGLMVRLRYAQVDQDDPAGTDLDDLRLMVYYDPPKF